MIETLASRQSEDTHQKALRINLDPRWYGTVAEIGAGQEVARWFFRVGGAAGTIAKSMSAYDMAVSDAVYGEADRYVSEARLQAMLDHEFALNIDRLSDSRGDSTSFFAFADTVVARSFRGGNECHGWMGVKFQAHPHDEPSQIALHLRMLDVEASLQQEALGIVGVNLLHGAFFEHHEPEVLVENLLDRLSTDRIEIDMIRFRGIEFRSVDNRLVALQLVQLGLSGVAMFGPDKEVLQPSEVLRKKAVIVERGSFRPTTVVNLDMLECAMAKFGAEPGMEGKTILPLAELTMRNLLAGGNGVDRRDFLARAELLAACGLTTMISDYFDYYLLAAFLAARTSERIGIVMGVPSLLDLFDERNHEQLQGGILESFGRLFKNDLKLYVYPLRRSAGDELETVENLHVAPAVRSLYDYLANRGSFVPLDNFRETCLPIFSRDVLRRIAAGDEAWEDMVPAGAADLIKKRGLLRLRPFARLTDHPSVHVDVGVDHPVVPEAGHRLGPDPVTIQRPDPGHGVDGAGHVRHQVPRRAVVDELGHGTPVEHDDRCAARHGLDHAEPEGLVEVDEVEQRQGPAEEGGTILGQHRAHELGPALGLGQARRHLRVEVPLILDDARQLQRDARGGRGVDGLNHTLVGMDASEEGQVGPRRRRERARVRCRCRDEWWRRSRAPGAGRHR